MNRRKNPTSHSIPTEALSVLLALTVVTCGPPSSPDVIDPEEGKLDCSSPVSYDGKRVSGEVAIGQIFGGGGSYEETAIRIPPERVETYFAGLTRLCKEFNAGILDKGEYRERADAVTQTLFQDYGPSATQKADFAAVYADFLGNDIVGTPLQLEVSMTAEIPGRAPVVVRPNQPVPTGAFAYFTVRLNVPGYLYMFQKTQRDGVTALFPHPALDLRNPLVPGQSYRIPPDATQKFEVNAEDVGTEKVYLLASPTELADVGTALAQMANSGGDPSLSQFQPLQPLANLEPGATTKSCTRALVLTQTGTPCVRSRGLVLVGGKDNLAPRSQPSASMVVRADPGDSTVVKVFPWNHVAAENLAIAEQQYAAADESGQRARGVLLE